jgi:hypothetical protein
MSEYLHGRCLLPALSGHCQAPGRCLLLGAKQTLAGPRVSRTHVRDRFVFWHPGQPVHLEGGCAISRSQEDAFAQHVIDNVGKT